ncbi:acyltransferase family protein [Nocardia bovistercoris]|uniref:Acyltransferase n=1 Tax=Nocardia bovistercoris TaxID=2785916 RepID=A0A931IBP7_9NOCA|nr:acyltransferase [Nocardia bovistercoris]MBH0778469.1 acyltransferase [Nocardia bovistercoris]
MTEGPGSVRREQGTTSDAVVASGAPATRNWTLELVRVFSIAVVVFVHWVSVRVTVVDGVVRGEATLHGRPIWLATWVLQVMPLFFLAGGYANTLVVDRCRAEGRTYGAYLGARARRLSIPVVALILFFVPLGLALGAYSDNAAATVADIVASPLWFLAIYLVAAAVAPLMLRAHDRSPWSAPAALLGASLLIDALRFNGYGRYAEWNLIFVWLFCHQLGVLYARRTFQRATDGAIVAAGVAGIVALVVMVGPGPYFPTMLGLLDAPVSNLAPPTSALSILAVAQFAVILLADRRLTAWTPRDSSRRVLGVIVATLMPIYLWHIPVMAVLTAPSLFLPAILPRDPALWWMTRPLWLIVGLAALICAVRILIRWDILWSAFTPRTTTSATITGTVLSAAGIFVLWRIGLGTDTTALLAALAVVLGTALLTTTRRTTPSG